MKRLRALLELTQPGLARALGVHPITVARWETGTRKIPEPVARLVERLRQEKRAKKKR